MTTMSKENDSKETEEAEAPDVGSAESAASTKQWAQLTSTLDACFQGADKAFTADDSTTDNFTKNAPKLMQSFIKHGEACTEVDALVMRVVDANGDIGQLVQLGDPMVVFEDTMDRLYDLFFQANDLHAAIADLTKPSDISTSETEAEAGSTPKKDTTAPVSDSQDPLEKESLKSGSATQKSQTRDELLPLFFSCLPTLQVRMSTLKMGLELVEGAKENLALTLRLDDPDGYDDEDDDDDF